MTCYCRHQITVPKVPILTGIDCGTSIWEIMPSKPKQEVLQIKGMEQPRFHTFGCELQICTFVVMAHCGVKCPANWTYFKISLNLERYRLSLVKIWCNEKIYEVTHFLSNSFRKYAGCLPVVYASIVGWQLGMRMAGHAPFYRNFLLSEKERKSKNSSTFKEFPLTVLYFLDV